MTIKATVIADSISFHDKRIVTLELQYPRFIHAEVMTHRVFSRNAMSSRAIPVSKMIEQVRNNPAMPNHWGANQPGMQASQEVQHAMHARDLWVAAAQAAATIAQSMADIGLHKQVANRVLEPFQWMRTLVTATEWENFFELRAHPDAQPEFQALAAAIQQAMDDSTPVRRQHITNSDNNSAWHLPYISDSERGLYQTGVLLKMSTARCARVSYLTHDGQQPDVQKDVDLYDRLVGSKPIHASPSEHQARAAALGDVSRNFRCWIQHRAILEGVN